MKDIYILGIETSCDETSASIVKNGSLEIATVILSQVDIHTLYGGVVPEIASRNHVKDITFVIDKCLQDSKMQINDIDAIAVTHGPGLIGSLLVGIEAAKTLAYVNNLPLIAINHLVSHIYANNIDKKFEFPLITLVISGGHTELILMNDHLNFKKIGATLDDAVGECYDKVARVLGLEYPGGPKVEKLAKLGDPLYKLPLPLNDDSLNFSFSGLKSAVINLVHKEKELNKENLCASFQNIVEETLASKTLKALNEYKVDNLMLAGGVSANQGIRKRFEKLAKENNFNFSYPEMKYCTDNATMVAAAGYFMYKEKKYAPLDLNGVSSDVIN